MKRIFIFFVFVLSCCTFKYMDEGMAALRNQPVQVAFNVLGYPDNEVRISDKIVYVWNNSTSYTYEAPYAETTNASLNAFQYGTAFLNGTTRGYQTQVAQSHCQVKIVVNRYGYIVDTEYYGGEAGCSRYAKKLRAYLNPKYQGAIF